MTEPDGIRSWKTGPVTITDTETGEVLATMGPGIMRAEYRQSTDWKPGYAYWDSEKMVFAEIDKDYTPSPTKAP